MGIRLEVNYSIFESNRICWKPFIDYDAMPVSSGSKTYFVGGRKTVPLSYYDRSENKWEQLKIIENVKPFGESEGTVISEN